MIRWFMLLGISGAHVQAAIALKPIISKGLSAPVAFVVAPGQSERFYVVEQAGRILIWEKGELLARPFLDIRSKVSYGGEKGLLGLVFHPQFSENGRYFLNYTTEKPQLTTLIVERNRQHDNEKILMEFSQPFSNHNGGDLAFDKQGYLYIATGDGGSGGDPANNGQSLNTFLGKILRIDVDHGEPYQIPESNPLTDPNQKREIYAWGLRNPWRFSFDKKTGAFFTGDVGQNRFEEIDLIEKGKNYGWKVMEGSHCYRPETNCNRKGLTLPLIDYGREEGGSVTGGFVYRGKKIPELEGVYVYGDFMSGNIWGLNYDQVKRKVIRTTLLLKSKVEIASFGEDLEGELYIVGYSGTIYQIVLNP
jgi:glucose/arabinose dehydrogenase